jgi:hypothetical protein
MGADPIGAPPAGQGNAEPAKNSEPRPPFERPSHELALSLFIPPLRIAAVELEWASGVMIQKSASSLQRIGDADLGTRTLASLMAAWGSPYMRVLLAWLIVLGAFAGSATAFGIWGSRKVAAHVRIETSCMLLDAAEKEGWISRSARFDLMQKVATSSTISAAVRDAADRMRSGCPGWKVP